MTIDREELRRKHAATTADPWFAPNYDDEEFIKAIHAELPDLLSALDAADRRIAELEAESARRGAAVAQGFLDMNEANQRINSLSARLTISTAATVADRQLIDRLRDGLREALEYMDSEHCDGPRGDRLRALLPPINPPPTGHSPP